MSTEYGQPPADLAPAVERELLQTTLFGATAELAQRQDPALVLQGVCETLVRASPHILAAWLYTFDSSDDRGRIGALYAAGAVPQAVLSAKRVDDLADYLAPQMLQGQQLMCFRLGASEVLAGGFGVTVNRSNYFERVGTEPLNLFGKVAGALLEQVTLRSRLREAAEYDDLTGLLNRPAIQAALDHIHARAEREQLPYAILLIDLDQFKTVNDHYGHQAGDAILAQVAQLLNNAVRHGDWVGRWGGEEFLILLPDAEADEAMGIADRARRAVGSRTFMIEQRRALQLTISGGLACYPLDELEPRQLLGIADAALYEAKDTGRNRVQRPTARGRRIYTMASRIETALQSDGLQPAYQAIVDLRTGRTIGYQALARLIANDTGHQGIIDAEEFIEVASLRHLIHRIDYSMFRSALRHCQEQVQCGVHVLHFINVSAGLLRQREMMNALTALLREHQSTCGPGEHPVVVEITERDFIDSHQALEMLHPLVDQGVRLAIDDFGSGYSSFRYLVDLPIHFLKIEGRLVRQAPTITKARAVIRSIRYIARELQLVTLAEGIEDAATADRMRELGVDLGQGRFFAPPALHASPSKRF
ncbi:MAG: EAL domain-containing protein [Gammaproteobacteria bacterium]